MGRRDRMALSLSLVLAVGLSLAPAYSLSRVVQNPSAQFGNVNAITAAQLKDYLHFVAADEMEGRDTPSRGLDLTARFLALQMSRWGLKPGGDQGTFLQRIVLKRSKVDTAATKAELSGKAFKYGEDFLAARGGGSASGGLVYAGHGWVVQSKGIDAYKGVDVKGKIVLVDGMRFGFPKDVTQADLQGTQGKDWDAPMSYALGHGAVGIVYIPDTRTLANWQSDLRFADRETTVVDRFQSSAGPTLPTLTASAPMLQALLEGEKLTAAEALALSQERSGAAAFDLTASKKLSFTVAMQSQDIMTQNVVGIVPGSDPKLSQEYVAIGCHYDHVGTQAASPGVDGIFNGADDDGSGTVALLAMAEAFSHGPKPKRSILFVWHCGEEKGLWGSRYFTETPTVPLKQIVAQLNIDMIGRSKPAGDMKPANRDLSGPDEIYVIGSKMMSTELGETSEKVNAAFLKLAFNYRYDDPKDPNGFFFRSDHYNYANKGIPIIFYFDGVHEDYHKVSDHADKIDYTKMEKVTRTIFATAWTLANAPTRPKVDKELPSELGARRGPRGRPGR